MKKRFLSLAAVMLTLSMAATASAAYSGASGTQGGKGGCTPVSCGFPSCLTSYIQQTASQCPLLSNGSKALDKLESRISFCDGKSQDTESFDCAVSVCGTSNGANVGGECTDQASCADSLCGQGSCNLSTLKDCIKNFCANYCGSGSCSSSPNCTKTPAVSQSPSAPVTAAPSQTPQPTKPVQAPAATPVQATETGKPAPDTATKADNLAFEQEVVRLVNEQRAASGFNALTFNSELSSIARIKSQDMHDNHYFSHTSPVFGSTFSLLDQYGISYKTAGENIAMGYTTPEAVVTGWMNSPGHRANILNASFTQIGVGYVASGNYWTQEFIG